MWMKEECFIRHIVEQHFGADAASLTFGGQVISQWVLP